MTVDSWLGPDLPALKELAEFDMKYARAINPDAPGMSAEQMAAVFALYPMLKNANERLQKEGAKLRGNHPATRGARGYTNRHRKQKCASDTWYALKPDLATHEFHQPSANGQSESGSSVFARRGHVGLAERLKQSCSLLRRHTDTGILHRESELHLFADPFE